MSEWKEYKLGDIAEILDFKRKPLSSMERNTRKGIYPYYGASGIIDNIDDFIFEGEHVLISEDGENLRTRQTPIAFLANGKFWVNNHAHIVKSDSIHNRLICYYFAQLDLNPYITGAVQPKLSQDSLNKIPIYLPTSIDERKRIVGVLSSLDDKIDLLNRENATLETLAETLFRHYFIENPDPTWTEGKLENVVEVLDYRRKPLSKMERDKMKNGNILYPYYGAAEIMDYIDDYLFDGEYILLGEDGTVRTDDGHPILQLATGKFWPNNHAHVLKAKEPFNNCFLWYYFKTSNIDEIVTGAVQPKINQANLMSLPIYEYPTELIKGFQNVANPLWNKIKSNRQQIQNLAALRDILLPRLMSGEVKVPGQ